MLRGQLSILDNSLHRGHQILDDGCHDHRPLEQIEQLEQIAHEDADVARTQANVVFEENAKEEDSDGEQGAEEVEAQAEPALGDEEAVEGSGVHVAMLLELVGEDVLFGRAANCGDACRIRIEKFKIFSSSLKYNGCCFLTHNESHFHT